MLIMVDLGLSHVGDRGVGDRGYNDDEDSHEYLLAAHPQGLSVCSSGQVCDE